jgi:hypothetical protein
LNKPLNDEIWGRLVCGKSMDDLQIVSKDGRVDLSGLSLPEAEVLRQFQFNNVDIGAAWCIFTERRDLQG